MVGSLRQRGVTGLIRYLEQLLGAGLCHSGVVSSLWSPGIQPLLRRLCGGPLEIGIHRPILCRRESLGQGTGVKLLYLSDLHLDRRWCATLIHQLLNALESVSFDVVLLGGDLVETHCCLDELTELVRSLRARAPVIAIPGNHDELLGEDLVRAAVLAGGGTWLPDADFRLPHPTSRIIFHSRPPAAAQRDTIHILGVHDPETIDPSAFSTAHLILAGHLHGGQVHLWSRKGRSYPGAFAYRWNGMRFQVGQSLVLISRGLVDFIPLRWACPREIIVCEV